MSRQQVASPTLQVELLPFARDIGSVAGLAVGLGGLFVDEMPTWVRIVLCVVAVALVLLGLWASRQMEKMAETLKVEKESISREFERVKGEIRSLGVPGILKGIARPLFRGDSGWRVTVYLLEEDETHDWWLRRVGRLSSSPRWEESGRARFRLEHSFFRNMDEADLSSTSITYTEQSGEFPDAAIALDDWLAFQERILGDRGIAESLTMRPRKYAWCAAREEEGDRRVVALMAESTKPSGIAVDVLTSPLIPALLSMVAQLSDVPEVLTNAIDRGAEALGVKQSPQPMVKQTNQKDDVVAGRQK